MYRYSIKPACACTLAEKLALCKSLNITNLELGGCIDGVKLSDMTPDQVEDARAALIAAGVAPVSAKISCCLCDDEAIRRWFQAAHFLGVEAAELPSPKTDDEAAYIESLRRPCAYAQSYGMQILLACKADTFLADDAGLTRVVKALAPAQVNVILDPYYHVSRGSSAFWKGYYASKLKNAVAVIRANDGLPTGEGKLPGEGSGDIRELMSLALARSFGGYFSIAAYPGFEDTGKWADVAAALRRELQNM
ncbi:MAG: sugar phosphate isomerase/epimerase [Ruminococcaceae bacterium]|nr:sugar phosphate isomerase/epimerase [Oscillospiraceae bacterium]